MSIPSFGLGTYRLQGQDVIDSVTNALSVGYRAIDTAQTYENEAEVGQAVAESGIERKELFITTKIWIPNLAKDKLMPSLEDSLKKLQTDYVDLTLVHWPSPNNEVPVSEYMNALLEAKKAGLTKQIGVSNFTVDLMQQAIDAVGADEIATNQIELHPYLQNRKVVGFAEQHHIRLTSYMTLGYGKVLEDPVIIDIANQLEATPAQVALAWALNLGYAVIPSSTNKDHLVSNLLAEKLQLSEQDMDRLAKLDSGQRFIDPHDIRPQWDE